MNYLALKPCPFCGGEAEMRKAYGYIDGWCVRCSQCKMTTLPILIDQPRITYADGTDETTRYTSEQAATIAAAAWNRRANNIDLDWKECVEVEHD